MKTLISRLISYVYRFRDRVSRDWLLALALFIVSFALYVRTMAPGLLDGDEGEFQINIYRLGVSHTGYPIFFLLGKLWTLLVPIGTIATRANLFSAFWGALTIATIFAFIYFLTHNRWAAVICALLLTASRVEWSQAIIPRPYTLNSLFVVLVVFSIFLWRIGKMDLTVPAFVVGLSLTNHRTMMWFAPAIAVLVLAADYQAVFGQAKPRGNLWAILRQWLSQSPLLKPRRLLSLVVAFVLPLLLYAYVFWRGESDVGVEFHWKDFNAEIMGGYVSASWRFGPLDWLISRVTDLYIPMLIEQFTAFGFIAGLIGMFALALDRVPKGWPRNLPAREVFLFILLANLASTAFCVIFWVIDIDKFFLQSFITFLLFTGVGIAVVWDWLVARPARWLTQSALALMFISAVGFLLANNYSGNDFSRRTEAITTWDENLSQPLEKNALIVGSWESLTPLEYAMYVDGKRTDLERWKVIVKNYQLGQVPYDSRQADIERAVHAGRPVYLTVHPSETETLGALADEFRPTRVGELWRVVNLPSQVSPTSTQAIATFKDRDGRALELIGTSVYPAPTLRAGDFGSLTLWWRAPQLVSARFSVSLRVVDAQDHVVYQRDAEPANGFRPTIGWSSDESVQDDAGFFIPSDAAPGAYRLVVVVYNPANGEELLTPQVAAVNVATVNVTPRSTP
jgi:hypothetical protein